MANADELRPGRMSVRGVLRTKAAVERVEAGSIGGGAAAAPYRPIYNPGIQRARVSVAIPSGSESSPSSTGRVVLKVKDAAGAWGDGEEVQVWSDFGGDAIEVGTMIRLGWVAGEWWIVSASC